MGYAPRTMVCDFDGCGTSSTEDQFGEGFQGWGGLTGILKDGKEVYLCPECLKKVCDFISQADK